MKFLVITNHSYMLWQFRKELLSKLLEYYDEVIICTPFNDKYSINNLRQLGCKCIRTNLDRRGINPARDLSLIKFYKKVLKTVKPDKVLTISIKPNIYAGLLCRDLKIPYFAIVQGLGTAFDKKYLAQFVSVLYKEALRGAKLVFFENSDNAKIFEDRGLLSKKKIKVVNGAGVNTDFYTQEAYPSEKEGIKFLYLGRLMKEKGVDELLAAFNSIKSKYNISLSLVGFFEDDYESEFYKQLNADNSKITFYGFTKNPKKYYAESHCIIIPSYHEGMNNVLLEAASTGRPIITTNVAGCREILEEGKTGFLCEAKNVNSLIDSMQKFLDLSEEERKQMGISGREYIEKFFKKEDVVNSMVFYLVD
jgi:galacturonosyltransferase